MSTPYTPSPTPASDGSTGNWSSQTPNYQQQGYAWQPGGYPYAGYIQKSKVVAGILGILLGAFGAHNFYLGRTMRAIAQLLITILSLGILAIVSEVWGLIEGILILVSQPGTTWHQDGRGIELKD